MAEVKSIMIVGVGGQGTLLASRLMGNILMEHGFDVKVSEVHGMAQRGGSVVTYVRYGEKVCSPIVDLGQADIIMAFERLEAARWLCYLKKGGKLIVNDQRIDPMPVITGAADYPENIIERLKEEEVNVVDVDALALALEAGSSKATNVVLIGVLSNLLPFSVEDWHHTIRNTVPEKFLEMNLKAFDLGRNAGK